MAAIFENLGLMDLVAKPDDAFRLASLVMSSGQRVRGYRGDYYRCYLGDGIVVARTMNDPATGEQQLLGMDVHAVSDCVWECKVIKDVTPEGVDELSRWILVQKDGCEDTAVVHVVCSDVLMTYHPGDVVRMNMVGFPQRIVFSDDACKPVVEGLKDSVLLQGTVKDVRVGKTSMGLEPMTQYISVTVSTSMGDVELCQIASQIEEDQKDLVKVGATVSAMCTLSGDAAIGELIGGIFHSEEQDLRLLREAFLNEDAPRLWSSMNSECVCELQHKGTVAEGAEEAVNALQDMMLAVGSKELDIDFGRITAVEQTGENPPVHIPGKRCLLLGDTNYPGYYALLVLVEVDSVGRMRRIIVTNDQRYDFEQEL